MRVTSERATLLITGGDLAGASWVALLITSVAGRRSTRCASLLTVGRAEAALVALLVLPDSTSGVLAAAGAPPREPTPAFLPGPGRLPAPAASASPAIPAASCLASMAPVRRNRL